MEEELTVDPKYKQAFNLGYLVAKHQPDLFKDMPANMNDPGLMAGKKEYEIEKGKEFFKKYDRGDGDKDRTKDKDKGMDR